MNLGWLIGPLIAAFVAEEYGIPLLFLLSSLFFFLGLLTYKLLFIGPKKKISSHIDGDILKNVKDFFKDKRLLKNYIISGSPPIWWAFIYVYIPLYILEKGLPLEWIAYFLFAAIIPAMTLYYYFNILADKMRYRIPFVLGNLFLALILLSCFFISNIYIVLILLVLGSIGVALIEPSAESYFFLIAPKKRIERNYSIYNTAMDVFPILSKILLAATIFVFSFAYTFLVLGVVFILFALISSTAKKISGHSK